jgi:hypothetical protein
VRAVSGRPSSPTAARAKRSGATGSRRLRGHRDGKRVHRLRASHSYGLVLYFIIAVFFVTAFAPDDDWSGSVLILMLGATLVCALWTSGAVAGRSRPSVALVTFSAILAGLNFVPGRDVTAAIGLLEGVLVITTAAVIARGVVDQGEVNLQSVRGAIAIYILLGLFFTFLYGALATGSSPLFAQGTDGTRAVRLYFSYVTLTTLGYGDFAPAHTAARTFAVVEALVGQLYLVTIVALLVSRLHTGRDADDGPVIPPG